MGINNYEDLAKKQKYIMRFENEIKKREVIFEKAKKAQIKAKDNLDKVKQEIDLFISTGRLPKRMLPRPKKEEDMPCEDDVVDELED